MEKIQFNKKKIMKGLYLILIIFLIIWSFFVFFGKFDLIDTVNIHFQETVENKYVIITDISSDGAFIVGNPIDIHIEISKLDGSKFTGGGDVAIFNAYPYPLITSPDGKMYGGAEIKLNMDEKGKNLVGEGTVIFSQSGQFPIYSWIDLPNEKNNRIGTSSKKIEIVNSMGWLSIEQNNRIFALTLIMLAFGLIELFPFLKNSIF